MADFPESLSVVHDGQQVINLTAEPIIQIDIRNGRLQITDEAGNALVELSGVRQGRLLRLGGQDHVGRLFLEDSGPGLGRAESPLEQAIELLFEVPSAMLPTAIGRIVGAHWGHRPPVCVGQQRTILVRD